MPSKILLRYCQVRSCLEKWHSSPSFWKFIRRGRFLYFLILVIIASSVFFGSPIKSAKAAAVTVDTSTSNLATSDSFQRKTFYDSTNSKYWSFYYNGSAIAYKYSTDGVTWAGTDTIAENTNDFSVWQNGSTIYLVNYISGSYYVRVRKGAVESTSINWDSPVDVGAGSTTVNQFVNITQDSNNRIWLIWGNRFGGDHHPMVRQSTNPSDITTWNSMTLISFADSRTFNILPLLNGDMYAIHDSILSSKAIYGRKYTASTSTWESVETIATSSTTAKLTSAVSDTLGNIHLVYKADEAIYYKQYTSGVWGSAVTLDSNATNDNPTITIDTANNDLWTFWTRSNTIYYKKGVSPYALENWDTDPTTLYSTGTNAYITSGYHTNGSIGYLTWTNGTGSPYDVYFDTNAPAPTPTPSPGGSGVKQPMNVLNFQAQAGDSQIELMWNNQSKNFRNLKIQRKTGGYPSSATDGDNVYDASGANFTDTGLTNGITYYYTAYSYIKPGGYSLGTSTSAMPMMTAVELIDEVVDELTEFEYLPIWPQRTEEEEKEAPIESLKKEEIEFKDFDFSIKKDLDWMKILPLEEYHIFINNDFKLEINKDIFPKEIKTITSRFGSKTYEAKEIDGKYQITGKTPGLKGSYELVIEIIYQDGTTAIIKQDVLIDPYGYVFRKSRSFWDSLLQKEEYEEVRILNAKVTLYSYSQTLRDWQVWDAKEYNQINPQITNQSGEYSFMTPKGRYYLEVEKAGYKKYTSEEFEVKDEIVNKNIEIQLATSNGLIYILAVLFLVLIIIVIIIYRGRRRPVDNYIASS